MKQALLTVGKPSAPYVARGLEDYQRRMKPWGGLELAHVRAAKAAKNRPAADITAAEAQRVLARITPRDVVWLLDVAGKGWTSEQWAAELDAARLGGAGRLVLVIAGHLGPDDALRARARRLVSLGPPTMAHEIAALVAAEQIYRAHTILAGTPYHRG